MSELEVAWPPMPPRSTTRVLNPSEAPYTAADRPAGPAPTTTRSNSMRSGLTGAPAATAISALVGFSRTSPLGNTMIGSSTPSPAAATSALPSARVGEAEAVRDRALLERLAQLVGPTRPRLADDVDRVRRRAVGLGPVEQHAGDRLVEQLVGRVRRAQHVVVEATVGDARRRSPRRSGSGPSRPTRSATPASRAGGAAGPRRAARCRSCRPATARPGPARRPTPDCGELLETRPRVRRGTAGRRRRSDARTGRAAPARQRSAPRRRHRPRQ